MEGRQMEDAASKCRVFHAGDTRHGFQACEGLHEGNVAVASGNFFSVTIWGLFSLLNAVDLFTLEF